MIIQATSSLHGMSSRLRQVVMDLLKADQMELPLLPEVAAKVIELTGSENADAQALAEIVHRDPALASNILRIANSPVFAPSSPIVSLQQAVTRLGMQRLAELALAIAMKGRMFMVPGQEEMVALIWHHSFATACFAREIARLKRVNVESAFLCGLLHDIGKPVILAAVARRWNTGQELLPGAVHVVLDEFHTAVGRRLIEKWRLPAFVADAILHHHDGNHDRELGDLCHIVALADLLAQTVVLPGVPMDVSEILECPALAPLNLYPDDLKTLMEKRKPIRELVEMVG
jgi:putative nucleotidyltransferase with HDIG domain